MQTTTQFNHNSLLNTTVITLSVFTTHCKQLHNSTTTLFQLKTQKLFCLFTAKENILGHRHHFSVLTALPHKHCLIHHHHPPERHYGLPPHSTYSVPALAQTPSLPSISITPLVGIHSRHTVQRPPPANHFTSHSPTPPCTTTSPFLISSRTAFPLLPIPFRCNSFPTTFHSHKGIVPALSFA